MYTKHIRPTHTRARGTKHDDIALIELHGTRTPVLPTIYFFQRDTHTTEPANHLHRVRTYPCTCNTKHTTPTHTRARGSKHDDIALIKLHGVRTTQGIAGPALLLQFLLRSLLCLWAVRRHLVGIPLPMHKLGVCIHGCLCPWSTYVYVYVSVYVSA